LLPSVNNHPSIHASFFTLFTKLNALLSSEFHWTRCMHVVHIANTRQANPSYINLSSS
jgi:hypothetical protein